MATPFIGEIRLFAGNFAPRSNAFCNGQLLPISQNTALFSLLGTTYGGNGQTTFGLPDLRGRAAMHSGNGSGLTPRSLGEMGGAPTQTLLSTEMPSHSHTALAGTIPGQQTSPANNALTRASTGVAYDAATSPNQGPTGGQLGAAGGNQPHNNMQPYLGLNYIIALQGVFPSRN